ncbi:MAG: DUF5615 family PIN-like protein [Anaerolineae bacterium]|nr:DUF5615 family PIN-like protein [Anaerolineae bacterium]
MAALRFYVDENLQVAIAEQLRQRGVDVVTVRELHFWGDEDKNHLQRASEMGYVLCTNDTGFAALASRHVSSSNIPVVMRKFPRLMRYSNPKNDIEYDAYTNLLLPVGSLSRALVGAFEQYEVRLPHLLGFLTTAALLKILFH